MYFKRSFTDQRIWALYVRCTSPWLGGLLLINMNKERRKSAGNQHSNRVWPAPSHFSVLSPVTTHWTPQTVSWNTLFLYYITFNVCFFTGTKKTQKEFCIAKMKKLEISNNILYAIISKACTYWPFSSSAPCWPFSRVSHTPVDVYLYMQDRQRKNMSC